MEQIINQVEEVNIQVVEEATMKKIKNSYQINQIGGIGYFFKVPDIKSSTIQFTRTVNILVADSSGSMSGYWMNMAKGWNRMVEGLDGEVSILLFDSVVHRLTGRILPIVQPFSGGTDIMAGINELENEIKKFSTLNSVVIFIATFLSF